MPQCYRCGHDRSILNGPAVQTEAGLYTRRTAVKMGSDHLWVKRFLFSLAGRDKQITWDAEKGETNGLDLSDVST